MLEEVCTEIGNGRHWLTITAIAGLGVGFLVMIIPPYQAELCHPDIRGRVTALQQFMLGVGALIASWVSWACYTHLPASDSGEWRIPLGIQLIPAAILALLILLFPESPRYVLLTAIWVTRAPNADAEIDGSLTTAEQRMASGHLLSCMLMAT